MRHIGDNAARGGALGRGLTRRRRWRWIVACLWASALLGGSASAKHGFGSAGAERLFVVAAASGQATGAGAASAVRAGVWLDAEGGARTRALGRVWGVRLGWVGNAATVGEAMGAAGVGGAARLGVAKSVWAWNRWWPGELLLTTDLWAAHDKATWYSSGSRAAPRVGVRLLLGYGGHLRARLRIDVAPALWVATAPGRDVRMSALWARLGVDLGPLTVGAWLHMATGRRRDTSGWSAIADRSVGLAVGLRSGRGRAR